MLPSNVSLFLYFLPVVCFNFSRGKLLDGAHLLPLCVFRSIGCMTCNSYVHQSSRYSQSQSCRWTFILYLLRLFSSDFYWNLSSCKSYADRQTNSLLLILGHKSVRPTGVPSSALTWRQFPWCIVLDDGRQPLIWDKIPPALQDTIVVSVHMLTPLVQENSDTYSFGLASNSPHH